MQMKMLDYFLSVRSKSEFFFHMKIKMELNWYWTFLLKEKIMQSTVCYKKQKNIMLFPFF